MRVLVLIFSCLALVSATAYADGGGAEPVLKVDLSQALANGVVEPVNGISTAGQPDTEALRVFADSGYKTVIDLRTPAEARGMDEAAEVESLGMQYLELPIAGAAAINFDNAAKLDALLKGSDGPVLLHCGSANRVGALLALRASLGGESDEDAIAFGKQAGMSGLTVTVENILKEK